MAGFDYGQMQAIATDLLRQFRQGTVTLTRTVPGEPPDPTMPWVKGPPVTAVFDLDATVKGVSERHVGGTLIEARDLEIKAAAKARHRQSGQVVDIDPAMSDRIEIDGVAHAVKRVLPVPAAGTPIVYTILVAG